MGLEVGGGGTEEKEEEKKEKIPLCESIGHRPLWSHYPAPTLNYNHNLPKQGANGNLQPHIITFGQSLIIKCLGNDMTGKS